LTAEFDWDQDVAVDPQGNLIIADTTMGRVRKIWDSPSTAPPRLTLQGPEAQKLSGGTISFRFVCDKACLVGAAATVTVGGQRVSLGHAGASQTGTLCAATVTLRLPAQAKTQLEKLLKPGAAARVQLTLSVADPSGKHAAHSTRTVTVRR
jgi:hypothetical protein